MFDRFIGEVKGIFNVITLIDLLIAIIYILVGLVFFTSPSMGDTIVSIITGVILIANGVTAIFSFLKRGDINLYNYNLIFGILMIITGILAMFLKNILIILIGIYFIVEGTQKIGYGLMLKKFNESSWFFTVIMGVLFAAIGIVGFFTSSDSLISVVGICLLGVGLINLINTILLRKRSRYFIA